LTILAHCSVCHELQKGWKTRIPTIYLRIFEWLKIRKVKTIWKKVVEVISRYWKTTRKFWVRIGGVRTEIRTVYFQSTGLKLYRYTIIVSDISYKLQMRPCYRWQAKCVFAQFISLITDFILTEDVHILRSVWFSSGLIASLSITLRSLVLQIYCKHLYFFIIYRSFSRFIVSLP
jgi:hypothetical protein